MELKFLNKPLLDVGQLTNKDLVPTLVSEQIRLNRYFTCVSQGTCRSLESEARPGDKWSHLMAKRHPDVSQGCLDAFQENFQICGRRWWNFECLYVLWSHWGVPVLSIYVHVPMKY